MLSSPCFHTTWPEVVGPNRFLSGCGLSPAPAAFAQLFAVAITPAMPVTSHLGALALDQAFLRRGIIWGGGGAHTRLKTQPPGLSPPCHLILRKA